MRTHQEASEKKSSAQNTFVPTPNPLAFRPFAVQPKPEEQESLHSMKRYESAIPEFSILNPEGGRAMPVQPKLAIGAPGDKYEQEADRVASQVVKQINSPDAAQSTQGQSVQRQEAPVEELQAKPSISDQKPSPLSPEVQQHGGAVMRSPQPQQRLPQHPTTETPSVSEGDRVLQAQGEMTGNRQISTEEQRPNKTGLPDRLKTGIENLSGYSMDDVKVHYNSDKPAQLQALAYAQGTAIHLASGQEKHLPHEAWHVVQQKQGRVKPTMQMKGNVNVNDDAGLEHEADVMGAKAALTTGESSLTPIMPTAFAETTQTTGLTSSPVQRCPNPAELAFMTREELNNLLETLSLHDLYITSMSLSALNKDVKPKPEHVVIVETYVAKQYETVLEQIEEFTKSTGYVVGKTLSIHRLFGNLTVTLYPIEGKNPKQQEKLSHRPHRPILDIEFVGQKPFARCYLGLYAQAPDSSFKDVTSSDLGKITLKDIGLMNLGNPFKALLWCEDYLSSQEHYKNNDDAKPEPKPVVRSFLVPLSDAAGLLLKEGDFAGTRPLDQDRGSGQFGNLGNKNIYAEVLHPLIGSLVSFFHDPDDYAKASDSGQKKFGLVDLQNFLTGHREDPRSIAKNKGIAAQHGRLNYKAEFDDKYTDVMTAYYDSVHNSQTEFTGATSGDSPAHRKSTIPKEFDKFPLVKEQVGLLSDEHLSEKSFKSTQPAKPSPSLVRLRAFIKAYADLPVHQDCVADDIALEDREKVDVSDKATSKDLPKSIESLPKEPSLLEEAASSTKVEKSNPKHQYASVENQGGPTIPADWFTLLVNPGGGDCLFHALEGRTLNGVEMLKIRGQVSSIRKRMPDTPQGQTYNANVAAATITQTPSLEHFAPMVQGRDTVPNSVLAKMQSIPGVYAGPEELMQWCKLRRRKVIVIDRDGSVVEYSADGSRLMFMYSARKCANIRGIIKSGKHIVLYKSLAHWELIQDVKSKLDC